MDRERRMNYRSFTDLNEAVRQWSTELPDDYDLIVGIPRSGMLVANLLSLYRDLPMTDVDGLCDGTLMATGRRYSGEVTGVSDADRVLVVDDSVNRGRQMTETRERLGSRDLPVDIEYGAVYISLDGHQHVDHWREVVPQPRAFEWNLLHHPNLENWCVDIDGVLCREPSEVENDDGERYREFLAEVDSHVVPTERIGWLVTCRLETYREETETWLDRHGIEYDELVMMDRPSMASRQRAGDHAEFKAAVYERTGADLFIESGSEQAGEIASRTGKPVYCFGSNRFVEPGRLPKTRNTGREVLSRFAESPLSFSNHAARFAWRRCLAWLRLAYARHSED